MGASRVNSSLELDVMDVCEGALLGNPRTLGSIADD